MNEVFPLAIVLATAAAAAFSAYARSEVPLIPREVLFGNPDKAQARISPDGAKISYLAPVNGVLNVWVGPADQPEAAKPVTHDTKRGIQIYFWAYTNRHILYLQDKDGDENWRVYAVSLESGTVRDLTPFEGVQARIQGVSHLFPAEILIGLNNRNPQLHDIYRVNIETGERSPVFENPGFLDFLTDDNYDVRLGVRFNPKGGMAVTKLSPEGKARALLTIGPEDVLTTNPVDFDRTGKVLYMLDSRGRDTAALTTLDLDTKKSTPIAQDRRVDVGEIMLHPTEKNIQAYATNYKRKEWHALDKGVAKDLKALRSVADGDLAVISRTLDDTKWIVAYTMDNGPVRYYRYDRQSKKATFLFTNRRELENLPLAHMRPTVIQARDGLSLISYLTVPAGADPKGDGRPAHPLPLVLWVHGGPWSRDAWGFNSVHQWLANRGYAVLSVNFRGSTGFGKRFINAANREWGAKMHDDLVDAVKWAVRQGIADPRRVAITGGSYGGYATLVGMTRTPDTFACGVDLVGPSNLVTWMNNIPEYWIPILPLLKDRVGDHMTEKGRAFLEERSPLTHAGHITKPLLIGQGANDPRVPRRESDQIVRGMQEHSIPVTYLMYPDEGHGFARPENWVSFFAVAEAFLSQHLGGRYQPIGDDFAGSSIEVLAGADQVAGLADALRK
jgi:dipeptidyl aminopeptidase/acylaminoacyl peptidase